MFKQYRKKQVAEMRPYRKGESMDGISVSDVDKANGSPKEGDMIAHNPDNHEDMWLVSAKYFADNFVEIEEEIDELDIPEKEPIPDELEIEEKPEIVDDDEVTN